MTAVLTDLVFQSVFVRRAKAPMTNRLAPQALHSAVAEPAGLR